MLLVLVFVNYSVTHGHSKTFPRSLLYFEMGLAPENKESSLASTPILPTLFFWTTTKQAEKPTIAFMFRTSVTMKSTVALAVMAALMSTPTDALALTQRRDESPKVVSFDLHRTTTVKNPVARDRLRRRETVQADLDNMETLYFVNATIGTPAQSLRLHVDTGSSDLWVNTDSSTLCQNSPDPCTYAGTYDANSSSTYSYVGSYFNISYVDGSGASGDYVTDTVTIGETEVEDLQFGIGYTSSSSQGILGIGYALNEVQVGRAGLDSYDNLPAKMVTDGLISSNAYSLWLNDLDASEGSILFGGVDTERFEGTLSTLPVQQSSGQYAEFLITLTKLTLGDDTVAEDQALAVLLDSGSSLTYLPDDWVVTVYNEVSASYDSTEGAAFVPCSLADSADDLVYSFSGVEISVSMSELVIDLATSSGKRPTFSNGVEACLFGVAPAGSGTSVLGDTFLRSAYVVYDLENNEISLAQTVFNASSSNVVEIGTGTDAVPSATAVSDSVSAASGVSLTTSIELEDDSAAPQGVKTSSLAVIIAFTVGTLMFGM
ncbi:aspartic proteinase precursor [Zalerion maritima]|uniref:Probable aspartic-type endopeptidase OPSB n=1 Tax=Zalerion maritima TaxID=339359 RepID=A0AAD5RFV1_9PEZI|nr:aspartic proteinase precursor [Zalerion maritima]